MFKRLLSALKHLGYTASFFADVPPFVIWLYHHSQWLIAMVIQEPIGSLALLCALAVAAALVWIAMRIRPPIL
jgi:hypothetical protein